MDKAGHAALGLWMTPCGTPRGVYLFVLAKGGRACRLAVPSYGLGNSLCPHACAPTSTAMGIPWLRPWGAQEQLLTWHAHTSLPPSPLEGVHCGWCCVLGCCVLGKGMRPQRLVGLEVVMLLPAPRSVDAWICLWSPVAVSPARLCRAAQSVLSRRLHGQACASDCWHICCR